jgi:hypothetical protein
LCFVYSYTLVSAVDSQEQQELLYLPQYNPAMAESIEAIRNSVWVPSRTDVFKRGYILEPVDDNKVKVRFDDGSVSVVILSL